MTSIKSMPLYATIDRVRNELRELGGDGPLAPEALYPFDQLHYDGTDAVRRAVDALALTRADRVLEIGSGIGGPARFLAHTVGCHVMAVELQQDIHDIASNLTARCALDTPVDHRCGDASVIDFPPQAFDAAVTWLAVHHIPKRPQLLQRIARALRPGGRFYIEDLYERAPFSSADARDVLEVLYGVTMTGADEYAEDVRAAGFEDVRVVDMTAGWTAFCAGRAAAFRANRARHVRVHGEATFDALDAFFTTVQRLFANGSLGGLTIVATKT